ncbi:U3 small nucleolar ribonucleoprotein protein MPP10-like [Montipora foliosa]|uniref:U3 small nucleolar ribonucleoprotein protein MPP10-like n=1 Tax=Montipora foliosa TaxID=591990 RepID=UPI0035F12DA8
MADDNEAMASLVSIISRFENTFSRPEAYLKPPISLEKENLALVKEIFDFCKKDEPKGSRSLAGTCPLQELLVDDFDLEQIWQEIELQNGPLLTLGKRDVQNVTQNAKNLTLLSARNSLGDAYGNHLKNELSESDSEAESVDMELNHYKNGENGVNDFGNDEDGSYDDDDEEDEEEEEEEDDDDYDRLVKGKRTIESKEKRKHTYSAKRTQVDDTFFKLSDMIQFLDREDRRFERAHKKKTQGMENDDNEDSDESDSELVDYFMDIDSNKEDEEDEDWSKALSATESLFGRKKQKGRKKKRISARKMKYADFFDPPDGEGEDEDDEKMSENEQELVEKGEAMVGDSERGMDLGEKEKAISSFEKKQQKLKQNIDKLENANVAPKPWQMSGEAGGNVRPINSLLEEDVSFDHATAAAPDITEETTQQLEDIVKQRIKDQAWDDVERKVKPVTEPFEYKKKIPLDQEKSKLSLSQIYEQEYLKQTQVEAEEKENEEHEEIKRMMTKLFAKLDALSNFHFTPKPLKPELKVVGNVPVISVEEVAPVTVSDAMMLAPEEVHEKKKQQKGTTELTETDRKRERRAKKQRQHQRAVEKLKGRKLIEKLRPGLGNKYAKQAALKRLEKDSKTSKNVSLLKDEGNDKAVKSSSAFFSRLQEEVRDQVKTKRETTKKKLNSTTTVTDMKL